MESGNRINRCNPKTEYRRDPLKKFSIIKRIYENKQVGKNSHLLIVVIDMYRIKSVISYII
jgi:hypothetical protein